MGRYWRQRMKFVPLIWSGIWRKPGRTILIVLQVSVAFALFGVLQGMKTGVEEAIARTRADLLLVFPNVFGEPPLPVAYRDRIQAIAGVTSAVALTPTMLGPGGVGAGDDVTAAQVVDGGAGGGLDVGVVYTPPLQHDLLYSGISPNVPGRLWGLTFGLNDNGAISDQLSGKRSLRVEADCPETAGIFSQRHLGGSSHVRSALFSGRTRFGSSSASSSRPTSSGLGSTTSPIASPNPSTTSAVA